MTATSKKETPKKESKKDPNQADTLLVVLLCHIKAQKVVVSLTTYDSLQHLIYQDTAGVARPYDRGVQRREGDVERCETAFPSLQRQGPNGSR